LRIQHAQAQFFAQQHLGDIGRQLFRQRQVQAGDKQHRTRQGGQAAQRFANGFGQNKRRGLHGVNPWKV